MKFLISVGLILLSYLTYSQNVGIGTTTPSNKLHVVGTGGLDPLRVDGLNMFVSEQNILVVDPAAGIVRYMHIDSLQARLDTTDFNALLTYIRDSLLNDSVFMDSINTDNQNLTLSNDTLYIEDGNWVVLNFSMDTNLIDSLIYAKLDTFYTIISDSLLVDSLWLAKLDSLINSDTIYFNDTSFTLYRDSLINDSLFLAAVRDSIETNIDTGYLLTFDTLILVEDVDTLIIPLDCKFEGRILYVSKQGNNNTAQIGKRCYPFADPWTAKDSAQAGDLIYIIEGIYSLGAIGSGADYEGTTATTLVKDSITFYFSPNTGIANTAPSADDIQILRIPDTMGNITFTIKGDGIFDAGFNWFYYSQDALSDKRNITIEGEKLTYSRIAFIQRECDSNSIFQIRFNKVYNEVLEDNLQTSFILFNTTDPSILIYNPQVNIDIKDFERNNYRYNTNSDFENLVEVRRLKSSNIDIKVGNYHGVMCGNGLVVSINGWVGANEDNQVNVEIGTMEVIHPGIYLGNFSKYRIDNTTQVANSNWAIDNRLPSLVQYYHQNSAYDFVNNNVNVKIGDLRGHVGMGVNATAASLTGTRDNNKIYIETNNVFTLDSCPAFYLYSFGVSPSHLQITLNNKGYAVSNEGTAIYSRGGGTNLLKITGGTISVKEAATPVGMIYNSGLSLSHTTLLNDGVTETIISPQGTSINAIIQNSFANSLTTDPNVTELVSPIIRDANVK